MLDCIIIIVDWIIENKGWLFSGVAVAVPLWWYSKRKNDAKKTSRYSVHQTHKGNGDNVGRDKNVKE
jgi:hypothetical protein